MNRFETMAMYMAYSALLKAGKIDALQEIFENVIEEAKKTDESENI